MTTMIDLDSEQETIGILVDLLWPNETIERSGLALAEEAGEVARAIIKREHAKVGDGDRAKERDWTANLRKELAQVVVTCLAIAQREGFSMREALFEEVESLDARREALGLDWGASSDTLPPLVTTTERRRCGCGDVAHFPNGCGPSGCLNRPA